MISNILDHKYLLCTVGQASTQPIYFSSMGWIVSIKPSNCWDGILLIRSILSAEQHPGCTRSGTLVELNALLKLATAFS